VKRPRRKTAPPAPARTVGDGRQALAAMIGVDPATIGHYALVIGTEAGVVISFCCDDRRQAAWMLRTAADQMLAVRGKGLHPDSPTAPMPEDN